MNYKNALKDLRILYVEDERELADSLKSAIGKYFYSFLVAYDAYEGEELFLRYHPDIVITDITMPGRSGFEMVKRVQTFNKNIPVIVISAYSDPPKFIEAIDIGVVKYVLKPFDPETLLETVAKIRSQTVTNRYRLACGFVFDMTKKSLYLSQKYVRLSQKERLFLYHMLRSRQNAMPIVDAKTIKLWLWETQDVSDERLRTFLKRLRQKTCKALIQTLRSEGYLLELAPDNIKRAME